MKGETIKEQFEREIATHELRIIRDDGLYRHLRFKRPDTIAYYFDIVTWPGHLAYSGDMGCYVFQRIEDMLEFFRGHSPNPSYWSEKVQAADKPCGLEKFSQDRFRECIEDDLQQYIEGHYPAPDAPDDETEEQRSFREDAIRTLRAAVNDEVLARLQEDDSGMLALQAAMDFKDESLSAAPFTDFWEHRLSEYTHRFLWCCHALPWAVARYDAAKDIAR